MVPQLPIFGTNVLELNTFVTINCGRHKLCAIGFPRVSVAQKSHLRYLFQTAIFVLVHSLS